MPVDSLRSGETVVERRDAASDSRLVANRASGYGPEGRRGDISAQGQQFILSSWADLAAGLWLVIAPFVLTYSTSIPRARANELIIGALVASMGATRVFGNYRSGRLNQLISALNVLPGIWLVAAPFILGYSDMSRPRWTDIITGIAIIVFSAWSYLTSAYHRDDTDR
jgi:hypothetical protein